MRKLYISKGGGGKVEEKVFNEKTLILDMWRWRCGGKRVFTFNFASSRADKKPAGQKEMFTKLNWEKERVIDYLPAREETRICV